jgi:excisionase family DNA binding protein
VGTAPAAFQLGHLVKVEDRGAEARLMAEVAALIIDRKPARRDEGGFLGGDGDHDFEHTPSSGAATNSVAYNVTQRIMLRQDAPLLTVAEVAERLRQSPSTIRRKARNGELPSLKLGLGERAPIRFDSRELADFIERKP